MKLLNLAWLFLAITVLSFTACKKDNTDLPETKPLSKADTQRLDFVLDSVCSALNIKGASAAILVPNVGIWKKAYGESHAGAPITTDMSFTVGSNSKTYIAALTLKLQEKGLLNINDTIGTWIKNKPYVNGQVTIKQLLNHTSGFGDFSFNPAFIQKIKNNFNRIWRPEEAYPFFQEPYFTPPGLAYAYSDQNYVLVGLIIEAVTGKPVEKSLREYILAPANLIQTVYYPFETNNLQIPHSWSADYSADGSLEDLDANYGYSRKAFCSADNAAGGMMSTAVENAQFWNRLMNGSILNQNSLQLMKEFGATGAPNQEYGLGLEHRINSLNGRSVYAHNGYVPGSINDNSYDPQSGVCISFLTNQDNILDFKPVLEALHKVTLKF